MRVLVGWAAMVALAGTAAAGPGDLSDLIHSDNPAPLTILDPAASTPCPQKPGLCIFAGARSTITVASTPVAAAAGPADKQSKSAIVVPRFSRAASVAASDGTATAAATTPPENSPWTLELTGTLKHTAWAGNALFIFFDLEDPDSIENRQFTALYQAPLKAGPKVAARVSLSPEDGFRPGHTYRIRIVQLISGKEIVLGESDVSLL
ncbi:MAG TPA: hypothetical protein VN947_02915 [Polyangia bacterium]|nr:hypothetical protein [Polyangia bacterium]